MAQCLIRSAGTGRACTNNPWRRVRRMQQQGHPLLTRLMNRALMHSFFSLSANINGSGILLRYYLVVHEISVKVLYVLSGLLST